MIVSLKLASWNVNGLRACIGKGFLEFLKTINPDIFCIQETKMHQEQLDLVLPGYAQFWNSAEKKGYSGTAIFTKHEPKNVKYDIGIPDHSHEGRVITLEYATFFLVNVYTPNSKENLQRIDYRMQWEDDLRRYLSSLDKKKAVILCGDLNVAHREIDLKNPSANHNSAGFTDIEREKFTELLKTGFIDTFRELYPDKIGMYTWWSYRSNARARGAGWRIDYFIVSQSLKEKIIDSIIIDSQFGSDHCPIALQIDVKL
jgi:exodeoxyribonuclease-3